MTQEELANAVSMSQPNIARIERGTVVPRVAILIRLLEATGHRLAVEPIGPTVDREAIRRCMAMNVPQRTRRALGRAGRTPTSGPIRVLRRLRRFGVPFVLVGELAEVAHGSPATVGRTVDVCHASTDAARERLALALADLGAEAEARRLRLLAQTDAGDGYDTLVRNAVGMRLDAGLLVRVAAIEDLIRIREARCTANDLGAAALLRAIEEAIDLTPAAG